MIRFLHKYSATLVKWLAPLGPWAILVFAAMDGAAWGMPLDLMVAGFIYQRPAWIWFYVLMAAVGSAAGSLVIYFIGRKGEEVLLERRISGARMEALRRRFEHHEFLAVMVPAILPPPTPMKLFVLAAGAFRMRVERFVAAIMAGRVIRFGVEGILVLWLGPAIAAALVTALGRHFWRAVMVAIVSGILLMLAWKRFHRRAR